MLFNYDWWFDAAYRDRVDEAKRRCAANHFPHLDTVKAVSDPEYNAFFAKLEARTVIYLRDGFSYEIKELIPRKTTSSLTFECSPADDTYKVGSFVVTLPFDDIVRVEIFAFHPDEKPEELAAIKGFAGAQGHPQKRVDERSLRPDVVD